MADEKTHANDKYRNPTSATAAPPIPPETFPEHLAEEKAEAKENAEEPEGPRDPAERRHAARQRAESR
jgi:hypothetical protein